MTFLFNLFAGYSQSKAYQQKKKEKIAKGSFFTKIVNKKKPATILYEDNYIVAFLPLRLQAKVHVLILQKRENTSINDINEEDAMLLGKLFLVAKK